IFKLASADMISRVLIVVFWLSFLLYGQERAPKTNEISCADTSTIHGKTSLARLKARFGAKNVISQGVVVGEGMEEPGAVIFPNDPERRLEIVWPTKSRGTLFIVRGKSDW